MDKLDVAVKKVAEKAAESWRGSTAYRSEVGIPLGVVAALALNAQWTDEDGAELIERLDDNEIADLLLNIWSFFTIIRPDLAFRCGPMGEWLNAEPRDQHTVVAAADVARAASKAGLFEIVSDVEKVQRVDLLGRLNQELTGQRDKQARGEFYTPGNVANMMARMSILGLKPGQSICDPCSGTGGLLRAAAEDLRRAGRDPGDYVWAACDIDRYAISAMAVNVELWGLGRNVIIGCANTLAEGDWHVRAIREQSEAIEAQRDRVRVAKLIALMQSGPDQDEADDEAAA